MAGISGEVNLEEGLTQEETMRSLVCAAEIESVLKKYNCKIVTTPIVHGMDVFTEIHVLPNQARR